MEYPNKLGADDNTCSTTFEQGLEFLLSHFTHPIFPRRITTEASENKQFTVYSKQDILNAARRANYQDCRVNAYPIDTDCKGINCQAPNIIFIDIDRNDFKSEAAHKQALQNCLDNIREEFEVQPTVIWSGNGYHIILPLDMPILEEVNEFKKFEQPSEKFLRYTEYELSNANADSEHKPSFKSCLLRIPGSLNKKYIVAGKKWEDSQVRIIQTWDGKRVRPKKQFMADFYAYLIAERIREREQQKKIEECFRRNKDSCRKGPRRYKWIETLLQTPIEDYRKHIVDLILAPYLINVRQLKYNEAYDIILGWLDKCKQLRRLDSNFKGRVKEALDTAVKDRIPPMKFVTLESRNKQLYDLIKAKIETQKAAGERRM